MSNINQTIIIRTDLFEEGHVGLISAQVAHIHAAIFVEGLRNESLSMEFKGEGSRTEENNLKEWLDDPYIFVKKVPNQESLLYFINASRAAGIAVREWRDTVYVKISPTQDKAFENVLVGISLGPVDADKIRTVIGDLPLL